MPFAEVNDEAPVRLFYTVHHAAAAEEKGKCFLCMGFQTDGINWRPQVNCLLERGYTCVTFDNRGCGRSDQPRCRYTTKMLARDAMHLLCRVIGWRPSEVHLVTVSMGGMYGLEMLTGLVEGAFADLVGSDSERHFLSAALFVTQAVGWRVPWRGLPPLAYLRIMGAASMPGASRKAKMFRSMEQAFSRDWLRMSSGQIHPKSGGELTNGQVIIRNGAKEWYAKIAEGVAPANSIAGFLGQVTAMATHYVSPARLNNFVEHLRYHEACPMLIVCAGHDNLVRYEAQLRLVEALGPAVVDVLNLPEGSHAVTDEHVHEVNIALLNLVNLADERCVSMRRSKL